ncbi:MFS transporter [Micromonospora sp. WMMD1076]|uniref:MFS transporter n=1 Tax=Micromonospora sp. WMMD1076 TaxID=3016103 RepID=UPI00249A9F00|nr:MFS transporter [Micromonospora sp. WMMD1076]WFF06948.1 MFS transporter [Micromonospora sp. WMMD1076]
MTSSPRSVPVPAPAGKREWAALVVLVLVVLLLAVDGTVLYLAVPSLTEDIGPTATQILWIGDIYAFVLAGLLITMGNLADRIGRKRLLMIGTVGFGSASALAAFASTPEVLIAARALLGLAGATLMPSTLSIVRSMFADRAQRARAIAIWSAGATAGAALGPLVGGALLERFWWGSVFLINVPVMALVAGRLLLPESKGEAPARIDVGSSALSIVTIVPLVFALKRLFSDGVDAVTVAATAVGLLAGWWFVRRQNRLAVPLLDVSLFKVPAFSGALAANVLAIFGFLGLLFFFSQYLQLVRDFGPLKAGVAELPGTLAAVLVVALIGVLLSRLGAGRAIGLGLLVAAVGLAVLGTSVDLRSYWGLGIGLAVIGLGIGVAMTLSTDAVVGAVPERRAGAASAVAETAYELGGALGIAVLGSVHGLLYRSSLTLPAGTTAADRALAEDSLAAAVYGSPAPGVVAAAQDAFAQAMQSATFVAAVILVGASVVAWKIIPSEPVPAGGVRVDH